MKASKLLRIGDIIRELRKQKNWTQKELAIKSGINEVQIRRYENNQAIPRDAQLSKIAEAFKVNKDYFFRQQVLSEVKKMDKTIADNPPKTIVLGRDKLTKPFTKPSEKPQNDKEISSNPDQNYIMDIDIDRNQRYNIIMLKYDSGEELTQEEKDYVIQYWKDNRLAEKLKQLPTKFKKLSEVLRQNYELLNTEGREKANEQLEHAVEQIELLTKIPEYQKKSEE